MCKKLANLMSACSTGLADKVEKLLDMGGDRFFVRAVEQRKKFMQKIVLYFIYFILNCVNGRE